MNWLPATLSVLAGTLELLGAWTVGNKKRYGFIIFIGCNVSWILFVIVTAGQAPGLLIVTVPMLFINIRNYRKWGRDERN